MLWPPEPVKLLKLDRGEMVHAFFSPPQGPARASFAFSGVPMNSRRG